MAKWSNVGVNVQSAISAAGTVTAISKANPAVVSEAAHPHADGDFILLKSVGMSELNGRVFRVANSAAGTYELEGVDSTNYDAFSSGTAKTITFALSMTTVTGVTGAGGDFDFIDETTIHDKIKKQSPGIPSALTYTLENKWDVADAALIEMNKASVAQTERAILFTFAGGEKMVFNGFVGASLVPTGSAHDKVVTSAVLTAFGLPTYYTS